MPRRLLAIADLGEGEDGSSIVLRGCSLGQKLVQNAGRAFFERYEKLKASPETSPEPSESADNDDEASKTTCSSPEKDRKPKKDRKGRDDALKLSELLKGEDLYALLECDSLCSQDDLKKSYKKLCLTHHPDKHSQNKSEAEMEEINRRFLKFQEAFDLLSDPKKRRKYDSLGDFDDSVPSGLKPGQDFFQVFGPVFKRNGKWSEKKPVPDLGDASTPFAKVERFYDWWRGDFSSWRDLDEKIIDQEGEDVFQDLDAAECREERRWMQVENERIRKKYQKVERARVMKLVENAEKNDPRVKAEKDRIWAEREAEKAKKNAKKAEAARAAEEAAELKRQAELAAQEAAKAEKARKEEERNARKSIRSSLRKQVSNMELCVSEDQLQDFFLRLEVEEMQSLSQTLQADPQADTVFEAMRSKNMEPIIVQKAEEEESTAEGSGLEDEAPCTEKPPVVKLTPEQEAENRRREQQLEKERKAQAEKQAAEKAQREAKKKQEQQKREAERKKQEKKEAERLKKEAEREQREAQKALEKAEKEKADNKRRAEQQSEKDRLEKEAELKRREEETAVLLLEADRRERADQFEAMPWEEVCEAARAVAAKEVEGRLLKAAATKSGEDKMDAQLASLGGIFVLGVRPSQSAPAVSSNLRNRIKKIRNRLRQALAANEFGELSGCGKADEATLEMLLSAAVDGKVEAPASQQAEAPAAVEEPAAASPTKSKKKGKAKAQEEDLDALLAEFGVEPKAEKSKKPKKK
jgi:curved DNA-binding protein CbpA